MRTRGACKDSCFGKVAERRVHQVGSLRSVERERISVTYAYFHAMPLTILIYTMNAYSLFQSIVYKDMIVLLLGSGGFD